MNSLILNSVNKINIVPGTIASVTLSGLSGTGGTISWTISTNAISYKWFVGTTYPIALISGTVNNVLTTQVTYAFVESTIYYAWVIPFSSSETYGGAITQSSASSYSRGLVTRLITTTGSGNISFGSGTQIIIECWGAGGGGKGQDSLVGAGAGGAYAKTTIAQTGAFTLFYSVGSGGIGSNTVGTAGGQTWATVGINAQPTTSTQGARAAGGNGSGVAGPNNSTQMANSIGQIIYIGGAGGYGGADPGAGGAATPNGNGNPGVNNIKGSSGGAAGPSGGAGGPGGGISSTLSGGDGISNVLGGGGGGGSYNKSGGMGGIPGGGGGGGWGTGGTPPTGSINTNPHGYGGDGGRGQIRITRS
jgi:hypothetical protein